IDMFECWALKMAVWCIYLPRIDVNSSKNNRLRLVKPNSGCIFDGNYHVLKQCCMYFSFLDA
ncbi:MAG: hypothetical protein O3C46_06775, partial [Bacteroidetes bacterium]|nr:hypothetical protein [Bacteroidota bacterium]